jgi:hypothetical protein
MMIPAFVIVYDQCGHEHRSPVELQAVRGSVNREGCSLCTDSKNPPSNASKSAAEPQKTALSNDPKIGGSELGELRALKME